MRVSASPVPAQTTPNFIHRVLEPPSYGWEAKPSTGELFRELFTRINVFADRKNWLALTNWVWTLGLIPFLLVALIGHFAWWMLPLGFLYSMVGMGTYGTVWLHRYGTHRAFTFSHPIWRFITRNLVIKVVPEEIYIVSHWVHHSIPDQPGDPYNAPAGGLYCFLADTNHQPIARDLSPEDYARVVKFVEHTGVHANSYGQYLRWGSIAHPLRTTLHFACNWAFWYAAFYLIGGHPLALALFGSAHIWALGIRTFNFAGHGGGKNKQVDGVDFHRKDLSINQIWPGFVAGEWHNNHHLYASSARSGFLWWQPDTAWYYIKFLFLIGGVSTYHNHRGRFLKQHWEPYLARKRAEEGRADADDKMEG